MHLGQCINTIGRTIIADQSVDTVTAVKEVGKGDCEAFETIGGAIEDREINDSSYVRDSNGGNNTIIIVDDEAADEIEEIEDDQTNRTIIVDAITDTIADESVNEDNRTAIITARVDKDVRKGTIIDTDQKDDDRNEINDGDDTVIVDVIHVIDSEGSKGRVTMTDTVIKEAKRIVDKDLDQDAHNITGDWEVQLGITIFQNLFRGMIIRKRIVKLFLSTTIANIGSNDAYENNDDEEDPNCYNVVGDISGDLVAIVFNEDLCFIDGFVDTKPPQL